MPSSRRGDYPSSLYPEVGSSTYRSGYGSDDNISSGYSARRDHDSNSDHYRDYRYSEDGGGDGARSRRPRHDDRNEGFSRRDDSQPRKEANRSQSSRRHQDRNNNNRTTRDRERRGDSRRNSTASTSSSGRIWERILPPDFRPSQADPDERHRRRSKEKECEGFDWTPGVVLALLGAAALFNHERSLVRRRKKDYIER
ncbi:hypothetical protein BBK36DRAFT_1125156 [Trichoderma citrinoviride]|uniref:Uncharacterized protein n=1 Tax=Trichoderma citrinoviride TaxID=58853 RepID=A0A2T4B3U1_9HYPO|nr:hypothetical protein BBK36DRAFT_1125156 [Trichoderma citrinoviride]PTB63996.1 hypothetical protein BBK36DRAFT_1125156 [Trichoderma citrinoviride]